MFYIQTKETTMRNLKTMQTTVDNGSDEIQKNLDNQTKFLKGILILAILQFLFILAII